MTHRIAAQLAAAAAATALTLVGVPATADAQPHKCRDSADGRAMICEVPDYPGNSYTVPYPAVPSYETTTPRPTHTAPKGHNDYDDGEVPTLTPTPAHRRNPVPDNGGSGGGGVGVPLVLLVAAAGGGWFLWRRRSAEDTPPAHTRSPVKLEWDDDDDDDWTPSPPRSAGPPAAPAAPPVPSGPSLMDGLVKQLNDEEGRG